MNQRTKRFLGLAVLTLLYPLLSRFTQYLPNPMVPGASVALNMVLPIIAGFFYGPISGLAAGGVGTAISALVYINPYDTAAILPHAVMGALAGWVGGRWRSEFLAALCIVAGHLLNLLFYIRLGMMSVSLAEAPPILLGLMTEIMVDVVAIILVIVLLRRWLYQVERW